MSKYDEILKAVDEQGGIDIAPGIYLSTSEYITAEQKGWPDVDEAKHVDFSVAPYWITTDDGATPVPVRSAEDLADEDINGDFSN